VQTMRKEKKSLYANATKLLLLIKIYTLFVVHTTQTCSWKVGQSPDSMYSIVGCTLHWHNYTQSLTRRCCCIFSENGSNQILVHHQQHAEGSKQSKNESYDPICHLRTGSPWFDVFDSFIAFICAFAALPAADLSNSSCLQV